MGTPTEDRESRFSGVFSSQNSVSGSSGSESDSGSSVFITQHPVRRKRHRRPGLTTSGVTSGNASTKKRERIVKLPTFGFYHLQDGKRTRFELKKHQNIHYHNSLIGGFFTSVRELQACQTGDLLSSLPTVDKEGDFIAPISEEEITLEEDVIAKKKDLVVFSKTKRPQPWYIPPEVNGQSGDASNTFHEREGRASRSRSSHGEPCGNMWTDNNLTQTEASEVKQEEMQDIEDSSSDATFCELPEEDTQNDRGASPAGAQLQANDQEELEAQNCDFKSQETKCKDTNVPLDHTVQVGESCSEMTEGSELKDKSIKKKKKKKKHQSESEDNYIDGSFFNDAISLPQNQELMVTRTSLDVCTESSADGVRESQQVTKKSKKRNKEKKRKRRQSVNPFSDNEPECDDSVSVKTEGEKQTTSFAAADEGMSVSESAEVTKREKVREKKKKRKLEAEIGDGKLSETLQMDEANRRKQEESPETFSRVFGHDADAGCEQIVQDGVKKKKKKKKRERGEVSPAGDQHIHSTQVSCRPLTQDRRSLTPDGHEPSPDTHTHNPSKKRSKRKSDHQQNVCQNLTGTETEAAEMEGTDVAAVFSQSPVALHQSSHRVNHRKDKRTLYNPNEDFLTGC